MRNPIRIDKIINYLKTISLTVAEVSFFSMLNTIFKESINYYTEDDIIISKLEAYLASNKISPDLLDKSTDSIKVAILDTLSQEGKKYPDMRFMQLINNIFYEYEYRPNFYASLEDNDIYQGLIKYFIKAK